MDYVVVGKFSQLNIEDIFVKDDFDNKIIDEKKIKAIIVSALTIIAWAAFSDYVYADGHYKDPVKLDAIFEFIHWIIFLIKIVFSGVIGLIMTIAGWKWATDLSNGAQTQAKTIIKNCIVGGAIIWTGASLGDAFVSQMDKILTGP